MSPPPAGYTNSQPANNVAASYRKDKASMQTYKNARPFRPGSASAFLPGANALGPPAKVGLVPPPPPPLPKSSEEAQTSDAFATWRSEKVPRSVPTMAADPVEWLESQVRAGFVPSPRQYSEVLSMLAKTGDVDGSVRVVNHMHQRGMQLHRTTLNSVITACAKSGGALEAEHWLRQMLQLKHVPNRATYCSLIIAWAKTGDLDRAEAWVKWLHDAGFRIPKSLNRPIIHTLLDSNTVKHPSGSEEDMSQIDRAANWLYRVHKLGAALESSTLNLIMFAYARSGDLGNTEKWATFMQKNGITPNHSTFCALVTACMVVGNKERAEQWTKRMKQLGFEPVDPDTVLENMDENQESTNSDGERERDDDQSSVRYDSWSAQDDILPQATLGAPPGLSCDEPAASSSLKNILCSFQPPALTEDIEPPALTEGEVSQHGDALR